MDNVITEYEDFKEKEHGTIFSFALCLNENAGDTLVYTNEVFDSRTTTQRKKKDMVY